MNLNRPASRVAALAAFVVLGTVACSEIAPTGVDEEALPDEPVTIEVRLPWDEFASDLSVFGGFGSPDDLGLGIVSHAYGDSLEARMLVRMLPVPTSVVARDTAGTQRTDTMFQILRGRIVAIVDSTGTVADGPVSLEVGLFHQAWDATTATWDRAVDSVGAETPWEEPGAGPVTDTFMTEWDPEAGDSAVFEMDSAQVERWRAALADTSSQEGLRLASLTEGVRLEVTNLVLQLDVTPSFNPDTTVVLVTNRQELTFVYTPSVGAPDDEIRVGGTPSWRSVLDIDVPQTLDEPADLCQRVTCPLALSAGSVNYAAIVLRSRRTPPAFAPSDSVNLDARPVFDRSTLPKSPLGNSLFTSSVGRRLAPALFSDDTETEVEIPITSFVRTLLQVDSATAVPPPHTLALLSTFEPVSIAFASFYGPGTPQAPELKLVITAGRSVELP